MKRMIPTIMIGAMILLALPACNLPLAFRAEDAGGQPADPDDGAGTDLPEFTLTPSLTASPTATFTRAAPLLSVSMDTNCRRGPGQVYDYLGGLMMGETAEAYARDPTGRYLYIRNPDAPGFCWVWIEYATITGDTSYLPVYTPEPTPTLSPTPPATPTPTPTTPALAAFAASYVGMSHCGASYLLKFRLSNTGGATWESISISANDLDLNTGVPVARDGFPAYTGCASSANPDLTPGEVVITASGNLPSNPTGHSFMAYIKVCPQDGLAGACKDMHIYFTP